MEFLVEFEIKIPEGTTESEVKDREGAEADAVAKLAEEGHLVRVWKLPVGSGETQVLGLYRADSEYRFTNGFSVVAIIALVVGTAPSLPGFLVQVKVLNPDSVPPFLVGLYSYAWFIGFALAFVAYLAGRKLTAIAPPAVALDRPQAALD